MNLLTGAIRFFARVLTFDCECPTCGAILRATGGGLGVGDRVSRAHREQGAIWNVVTGRLRCPSCRRLYVAGLLLYPVDVHNGRQIRPPEDRVPSALQRAALRSLREGFLMPDPRKPGEHANVALESRCTCPEGAWSEDCPAHAYLRAVLRGEDEPEGEP